MQELEVGHVQSESRFGAASDKGRRSHNEDYCAVRDYSARRRPKYLGFMAIADGMGGHRSGEVASSTAVRLLEQHMNPTVFEGPADFEERAESVLWNAFSAANSHIHDLGAANPELEGMGTTLTCAAIGFDDAYIAHVGDTRAYHVSPSGITQVTEDHSVTGKMVAEGILTESQARTHARRNVLTRAVGPEISVEIDILKIRVERGDVIFMCCDGLHSTVTAGDIYHVLGSEPDLQAACRTLVDMAIERGSDDNVSAVAWRKPSKETPGRARRAGAARSRPASRPVPLWAKALLVLLTLCVGFAAGWGLGALFMGNDRVKRTPPDSRSGPAEGSSPRGNQPSSRGPAEGNGFAEGQTVVVSVTSGTCSLRGTPDTSTQPLAQLANGCRLEVLSAIAKKDPGGMQWYNVRVVDSASVYRGREGYVAARYLKEP